MRRLAAKAAGRKHLRRAPANCLQMRAHVLLGTPAVAEAPLRSGATTLAADRSTPAGFLACRALAHSRFPVPHRWLGGRELPCTCLGGGGWGGTAPCRAVKQLPRAISPPGKEAHCPRASVSPRGWAAPCHGDAGLCSAPRGARGHPRGGSGPGRVPQHTAGSRPGTNPYLPPLGRSPGAGCAGCVEPGVPSPSPAATPCASTPGTVTHPRPSAGTSSLRGRPLSPPALRCRRTRCCWPRHAGEGNTQTPQAPATRPLGPPGLGRCKKGGLPSPCWDPSMTLCALRGHSRAPSLRGCCPCTVETPAPPASLYHQP